MSKPLNIAAWTVEGEWQLFADENSRLVSDQAHYQANLKGELKRELVLLRLSVQDGSTTYWFYFGPDDNSGNLTPVVYTQDIPKELQALLTVYGL
ncbi:hypothetical protein [Pseudomonas phage PASB7]|nr:hypothetical protein [Pseudomonas phage PASB7]